MMHPLLKQQLESLGLADAAAPIDQAAWSQLLDEISRSYSQAEAAAPPAPPKLEVQAGFADVDGADEQLYTLRSVLDSLGAGFCILDSAGVFISASSQSEYLLGWTEAELAGHNLHDILVSTTESGIAQIMTAVAAGEKHRDADARFLCQSGDTLQVSFLLHPLIENGMLQGSMLAFIDMSERKLIEAQLQTTLSETLLINRVIAAAAGELDPISMLGVVCKELSLAFILPQAAVALLNEDGESLTVVAEHLIGDRPTALGEIIPVKGNAVTERVIETQRSWVIDNAQTDPDQEILSDLYTRRGTVSLMIVPLLIRGQVVGTLGLDALGSRQFTNDEVALAERVAAAISQALENAQLYSAMQQELAERKSMQEKLQQARDAAMAASRAKSDFLAMMTHEIRTPMNVILGMTELLSDIVVDGDGGHYVATLQKAAGSMLTLINDVLDLSKIEAGQIVLDEIAFDVGELVERTGEIMALSAHAKGIELVLHIDPRLPRDRFGDSGRLRQVLVNLLGNAIKFTEQGEVVLRVERSAANDVEGVLFSVADTGPGIPVGRMEAIFQSFTQGDSSVTRRHGGTGLGLSISRSLTELLGGSLDVTSEVGHGSIFSFIIPLALQRDATAEIPAPPAQHNGRVLVVDDNAAVREFASAVLRSGGFDPVAVDTCRAAQEQIRQARRDNNSFSLMFLDAGMVSDDVQQIAAELREQQAGASLYMLIPPDRRRNSAKFEQLGVNDYLVKPLHSQLLLDAANCAINGRTAPPSQRQNTTPEVARRSRCVLLVEDSPDNRLLIETHLRKAGHQVDVAENGQEGVVKFMTGDYDLVLMDVQMPIMDGYTATREIRDWEISRRRDPLPIIALTAHALKDDMEASLAAGCNGHVTKPISKSRLLELVDRYATSRDERLLPR